jgi:hypothetical protein
MPLEKVFVPVDLSGSLQTKTDQKMVLPSELTGLENGIFKTGSTITKRNGYTALKKKIAGTSLTISSGDSLATFQNELLLFSGSSLYSFASGFQEWINKGSTQSVTIESDEIIRNDYEQSDPSIAVGNGQILTAWQDTQGGVRASVMDSNSGAIIQNNTEISATGTHPRCVELDGRVAVIYYETAGTDSIKIRLISATDPTVFSSAVELGNDAATSGQQIALCKYNQAAVVAYADSSSKIKVIYVTPDGQTGSLGNGYQAPVQINAQAEDCIDLFRDDVNDGDFYVAYGKSTAGTGLKVTRLDVDLSEVQTLTVQATSTAIKHVTMSLNSSNNIEVIYEVNATASYDHYIRKATITYHVSSSSIGSPADLKRSVGLASRAFLYSGSIYFVAVHESSLQSTYFLLDSSGLIVAKLYTGVAGGIQSTSCLSDLIDVTTGIYQVPLQIKTRLTSRDNDLYSLKGISKSKVDFTSTSNFDTEELGLNLLSGGGFISNYDGQVIAEHGFHIYPENVSGAVASGGSLTAGAYQFKVIYVHTDAQGQIYRSAPSVAVSATTASSNLTVNLTIPTLRLTTHSNVICEVYRTVDTGTVFYKVGSVANSTTSDTVAFSDTGAINNTNLLAKELLYTTGSVLAHVAPPATSVIGSFANRIFAISSENPKVLYYSQKRAKGQPVEFSDSLFITFNKAAEVTALAEMDEKLIVFEKDRIFYLTGSGPTATGEQNSFSDPQLVTSDVGCSNTRSIVQMPNGLMFMSNKGVYLLDRGMSTQYIGAPVETYNGLTISSAILLQDENQVRFTASDGVALVFDYFANKWSTFTNHDANGAVIWLANGSYVYLRTSGGLCYQESATRYSDVGAAIQLKITTAWIKPSSIQGFQRCRRAVLLGDFKSNHTLEARVAYDFRQYFNELHTFNFITATGTDEYGDENPYGSEIYGAGTSGNADGVYQFRMSLQKQKCDSIRFQFSDTVSTDPGQAYSISNLMLEIGLKNSAMKLPAYKST